MAEPAPARVIMTRSDLDGLPGFSPASGHSLRWYKPGDRQYWIQIHQVIEPRRVIGPELFTRVFGEDDRLLADRQAFLVGRDNLVIGTATAWFDPNFRGMEYGRVHWLAVRPEFQQRGYGRVLLSAVCNRLKELGHKRAYLVTWTDRLRAIRLYEKFGFTVVRVGDWEVARATGTPQ